MKYAIETFSLTKMYKKFIAVNNLEMKIRNHSIFGMLGPNGAGKTTTIKMLTCLAQPTYGTAKVGGYDIKDNPNEVRDLLGMVPQHVSLYKDLTVKENAELCSDFYGVPSDEKFDRINDLMELVDIKYAENKKIGQLSGGQKQKASLVASLIHRPDILFLDEPTIGLDPTTKRILWSLIEDLNDDGHTIILCSHDMNEVDMLCDNVAIINTGNLVAYDTPTGLKDSLLREQKKEYNHISSALGLIQQENDHQENDIIDEVESDSQKALRIAREKLFEYRHMSVLINNLDEDMINAVSEIPYVHNLNILDRGRIEFGIDRFENNSVNSVLNVLINKGAIISSVYTQEPSLEDVFIKTTSKVQSSPRA